MMSESITSLDYGDDISFHICVDDGFILSESVCDSDISSWWTDDNDDDSEIVSLDIDHDDFWLEDADDTNVLHRGNTTTIICKDRRGQVPVERIEFDQFSFHQHDTNKIVYDVNDTESETDDDDDDEHDLDSCFDCGVRKCVDLSFTTTSTAMSTKYDGDDLDDSMTAFEVFHYDCCSSCCRCSYCRTMPSASSPIRVFSSMEVKHLPISGFELYLVFYGMALVMFLATKVFPIDVQKIGIQQKASRWGRDQDDVRTESCLSFQPRENIESMISL